MFPDATSDPARTVETAKRVLLDDFFGVLFVGRMDDETMGAVGAMARDAHVSLGIGAAPVLLGGKHNLASLDEGARQAAVEALHRSVDDAYALGAPVVELLDGARSYPGPELEARATDQLVLSLTELCRYAEERAVNEPAWILLEPFDRFVDKRSLVGPIDLAVRVAQRVRAHHRNFGLTVDMGHLPLIGESYLEALKGAGEHLVHVHLGSCVRVQGHPAYGDNHPCFGMSGGEADVAELTRFLAALMQVGYFERSLPTGVPWLTFEVKPQPGQSSDLLVANCKRVFKEAWAWL